ncbi:MAG: HD domain-containing protein [Chloroflexi bacterium]|jgi:putative nucleotidyltransferase with HDIG domain|nr:HD domain-containing protein [Chloroflexota bacterium]MBT3669311.1 HD domain-containing protein [Chloroflexota bacterium]MBT4003490.1 HD domain-containing protein [Chloroflexota bacterium]MBT4306018.1 HD domain-containing protein [Chloroflexota bacterium]MBT4532662.1 HD domain-containing protein [Chloroflexota bacterium]
MSRSKISYRINQFLLALLAKPGKKDLVFVSSILNSEQFGLFKKFQASEQFHAIAVCRQILEQVDNDEDLLTAALLHDIGKIRYPLNIFDRIMIVLGNKLFPNQIKIWGKNEPKGFFKAFVVSEMHPKWGAEMVKKTNASPMVLSLILRHQDNIIKFENSEEDQFLKVLQYCDNNN